MPNFNKNDFSGNPVRLDAARTTFRMPFKHKTTFSAGKLIPIFSYGDVLPGDTFKVDLSCLVRMTTPVFPTMDDAYMDVYFFFTPHKLTLSREMMSPTVTDSVHSWSAFIGAQDSLLNMPTPSDVMLPFFFVHKGGGNAADLHSLSDYLGLGRTGAVHCINCLEPLAYYSIWNNYFRDENTMNPVCYSVDSTYTNNINVDLAMYGRNPLKLSGFDGSARWGSGQNCIGLADSILPVCRPHGYFGSCLPWPQRNLTQVEIPLLGSLPVVTGSEHNGNSAYWVGQTALKFRSGTTGAVAGTGDLGTNSGFLYQGSGSFTPTTDGLVPSNLYADLSSATGVSINQLRALVQTQRFYEALARGGNRIGEMTASMFGVTPSDFSQDRPEYLGGKRIPISMDQVANTAGDRAGSSSGGSNTQTLGSLGAYSNTGDSSFYFEKSFDTWGTITCVICVRTNETFSQGIPRRYWRKRRLDFYWPQFANLGEQPVLKKELYLSGTYSPTQEDVFGYQEAWAEYRYLPDIVSGELRPGESLGAYTYANNFASAPTLSGYMDGSNIAANIDRTLVVPGTTAGFQFIGDFAFDIVATRPMPLNSIPGLVDHH